MQFDEFDNKVKDAADHHHPAYDEQAWTKMEKLLNTHLPQKEDDRRRFLFLLLIFIGLGGAGLFIAKPWKKDHSITAEQTVQQKPTLISQPGSETGKEMTGTTDRIEANTNDVNTPVTVTNDKPPADPSSIQQPAILASKNNNKKTSTPPAPFIASLGVKKDKVTTSNDKKDEPVKDGAASLTGKNTSPLKDVVNTDNKQNEPAAKSPLVANTKPANELTTASTKENPVTQNTDKKTKNKTKKNNSFFFTLSAGPDMSFVASGKTGSTKLLTGAGLGYTFNDRFTIRTGFYTARKVYTAPPSAYHAPDYFYTYYPNLEKVDADCKVYEIPLSLSYNFSKSAKKNLFASAGVSSYLMKRETYTYFYKYYPTSPTVSRQWTTKNENQHYFSTLTLSGGYQRNFGKHITVMAEPYIKLPLTGVGYGKVKLNSAGVLFTVGIKPFVTKKGKPGN